MQTNGSGNNEECEVQRNKNEKQEEKEKNILNSEQRRKIGGKP